MMLRILAPDERQRKHFLLSDERPLTREAIRCGTRWLPRHKGSPYMELNPAKVREALANTGKSQADLSRLTGWSEAKVSRWVHGKPGEVTLTNLNELAAALGVSPAALVDLDDVAQDEAEKKLLRNFRAAAARDKALAQAQVEPRQPPD